jgi:[ribosomal protein S18]-alanine N-acetyltransferase
MTIAPVPRGTDLAPYARLLAQCFPDPWSAQGLADLLATPGTFLFDRDGGFILARAAAGEAEILILAVSPEARQQGAGTALVETAAAHAFGMGARVMFLEVAADNLAAQALYRRLGFVEAGRRKGYYEAGRERPEDALILRSILPLSPLGKTHGDG